MVKRLKRIGIARSISDVCGRGGKMNRFKITKPEMRATSSDGLRELEMGRAGRNGMRKGTRSARRGYGFVDVSVSDGIG